MTDILICPIGFTASYYQVNYHINDEDNRQVNDWISGRALLKLRKGEDWKNTHIIVIYPDNDGAKKSIYEGWRPTDKEYRFDTGRRSVQEVFEECNSVHYIDVPDDIFVGEKNLANLMLELHDHILGLLENTDETTITYDLTHSYRHLSFAALIQSIYLADFEYTNMHIDEIYYAFGKQPMNHGDDLYYINLSSFTDLIRDTGTIRTSVEQLRPKPLNDLARKYGKLYKRMQHSGRKLPYLNWIGKNLGDIAHQLTQLQVGLCRDEVLEQLQDLISQEYNEDLDDLEIAPSIFYSQLKEELKELLDKFEENGKLIPIYLRRLELGKLSFYQQLDEVKAYLFMRESLFTYFYHNISNLENDIVKEKIQQAIAGSQSGELSGKIKNFFDLANEIVSERNIYAHVYSGRDSADDLKIKNRKELTKKHLQQLENWLSEDSKMEEIVDFVKTYSL